MSRSSACFELIQDIQKRSEGFFTVVQLCRILEVSRSGYYRWLQAAEDRALREEQDRADFSLILEAYQAHGRFKGARAIAMELAHRSEGAVIMNVKKIRRLMKKFHLECPIRKANPYRRLAKALRTSHVASNHLKREFEQNGPRSVLLTDITYIPYNGRFAYMSTILDAYTKEILAYRVSDSLEVDFVLETVRDLMEHHGDSLQTNALIHSDQGCHYTSTAFIKLVRSKKLRQSMSRRGNCWDNAPQESFFGHMKDEIRDRLAGCICFEDVKALLDEQIDYYNNYRYQWKLARLAPSEFYRYIQTGIYPIEGVQIPKHLVSPAKSAKQDSSCLSSENEQL